MRIFRPTLSDRSLVTSRKTPQIPGCNAFKNPMSFVLNPYDKKYRVNNPNETPNIRLFTNPA